MGLSLPTAMGPGLAASVTAGDCLAMHVRHYGDFIWRIVAIAPVETILEPVTHEASRSYVGTRRLVEALLDGSARPCSFVGA